MAPKKCGALQFSIGTDLDVGASLRFAGSAYNPPNRMNAPLHGSAWPHILYIEDNPDDAMLLHVAVSRLHLPLLVRTVETIPAACVHLVTCASPGCSAPLPPVVLTDFDVRSDTALSLIRWIRERPPFQNVIIVVTSDKMCGVAGNQCYAEGADYCLSKHFHPADRETFLGCLLQGLTVNPPDLSGLRLLPSYCPPPPPGQGTPGHSARPGV